MNPENIMWTEKFRPKKVNDLVGDFKEKILQYLQNPESIPHFLLYSKSPGTGKSSLSRAIINELGCDKLILNSSDDRTIDSVREKVKEFSMTQSSIPGLRRCVFLDEVDGMLKVSQDALRNVMETYAKNVFFILTCVRKNTSIYTPFGFKKVQDIKNDIVHTNKSFLENKKIIKGQKNTILTFKTKHGFNIDVTPEHRFLINNKWVEANKLKENDIIDINLSKIYGNNIELENDHYFIFDKEKINDFSNYLIKLGYFKQEYIKQIKELRSKNLLPQEVLIFKNMKVNKKYTIFDIMKLDNNKLKKHRYNKIISNGKNVGVIKTVGNNRHTKYIRIADDLENYNFYRIVDIINKKYNSNYNTKQIYEICRTTNKYTVEEIIKELNSIFNMTSLNYDKISAFGRLLGFMYGDGHLTLNHFHFAGNKKCLTKVKNDINLFFDEKLKIKKNGYKNGNGYCIILTKLPLALLFCYLGCPKGGKVGQTMFVPKICYKNKLLIKSFIQSLFDCECLHMVVNKNNKSINNIRFMQKNLANLFGKDKFFDELCLILKKEFNINSYSLYTYEKFNNQYKFINKRRMNKYLYLKGEEELLKYIEQIGFHYEDYKKRIDIYGYLLYKKNRIGNKVLPFNDWKKEFFKNGLLKDKIINLFRKDGNFEVYDLVLDKEHSYISNGFISHNCNNINKVIEPIQSRCVKIPFAYPKKEEIKKYLEYICLKENLQYTDEGLNKLIDLHYPSIRDCVLTLQDLFTEQKQVTIETVLHTNNLFEEIWKLYKDKNWKEIKRIVLATTVDPRELNTFFWNKTMQEEEPN